MGNKRSDSALVVIGLGRFGQAIALELERAGTEVLGIDSNAKVVQAFSTEITHVVQADTTDEHALRQLGVHEFERAVIGIGSNLESSILTASLLVGFRVREIWAKAVTDSHARILRQLGVHKVVRPEHDMGRRVAHLIRDRVLDYIEFDDGYAIVKLQVPRSIVGVPLAESNVRKNYGVTIVGAKRRGQDFTHATPETIVRKGDLIIVSGARELVERFADID